MRIGVEHWIQVWILIIWEVLVIVVIIIVVIVVVVIVVIVRRIIGINLIGIVTVNDNIWLFCGAIFGDDFDMSFMIRPRVHIHLLICRCEVIVYARKHTR
jgi:hypothetical protein